MLRETMLKTISPEDLQGIAGAMVERAKQGDVAAARLVLAYTVGKPGPAVDPDNLDVQEWLLWQQMAVPTQAVQGLVGNLQAPLACILARTLLPLIQQSLAQELGPKSSPNTPKQEHQDPKDLEKQETTPPRGGATDGQDAGPAEPVPFLGGTRKTLAGQGDGSNASKPTTGQGAASGPERSADDPDEETRNPKEELSRWLQWLEQSVLFDSSAKGSPTLPTAGQHPEPVLSG